MQNIRKNSEFLRRVQGKGGNSTNLKGKGAFLAKAVYQGDIILGKYCNKTTKH